MTIFIVVMHVIVCLVLVVVILLQAGRGQGLGGASFGAGGGVQTLFGTKAGDFLTKATSVCAILFLITCISLDVIEARKSKSLLSSSAGDKQMSQADIQKIKDMLEKLKKEEAAKKAETPATPEVSEAPKAAEVPVAPVVETAVPEKVQSS